ncbi:sigma-70 family RNA polymerase sigma factor [Isoptericola cucumis]|uniref:sigma-70 family RNA polymerase sigma factor n=1 Tax=Isoptericola cucumis TaxID=1776856 RepID=UPI00166BC058|nr:sigma-70 family RNA polymerase sigma factor [Isoptericola cucumis]
MTDVYARPGDSARSDAELILEVRGGDLDAYGALFERHAAAARSVARQYARSAADADDLVSEAFHRVLDVLQHGGGPDATFRAYLLTVVRRLAADLAKGLQRTRPTDDEHTLDSGLDSVASTELPALASFERSVVRQAYEALPERWQAVLWYTEVEGRAPAEVAPILGLTPNGVSALAYRAREGLRVGYLQEHLTSAPSEGCRAVNPMLGSYVRGGLARREVAKVDAHVADCPECRALVLELSDVAHGMRAVVAPLIVGMAGMAVVGALPIGGALVGGLTWAGVTAVGTGAAGAGVVAGTSGSVAGAGVGAGTAGAVSTGVVTGGFAGTSTLGTGVIGAGGTGVAATGGAAAGGTAAASGAGVAAAAGATVASAGSAAAGTAGAAVAVTTGAAAMGGATVAATAGAIAVATVGVVTVLTAMNPPESTPTASEPTVVSVPGAPWQVPWEDADGDPRPADEPADDDPAVLPTSPANLGGGTLFAALADPAVLDVSAASTDALQPRTTQPVAFTVTNTGGSDADGAYIEVALPEGLDLVRPPSPAGAAAPTEPLGAGDLACTPTDDTQRVVRCELGSVPPGESRTRTVPVLARSGGSYAVAAHVWADDLARQSVALPPTTVLPYGAELTAQAGQVLSVANPGEAWVPVTVQNTGDLPAGPGWSALVTVPAGLHPVGADGELGCSPAQDGAWSCAPGAGAAPLGAGEARTARIQVVADGASPAGAADVAVQPALPGSTHVVAGSARLDVAEPWAGATTGGQGVQAWCVARGGVAEARSVVGATYVNRTAQTVRLRLDAAGDSRAADQVLAPGASATVRVPDGMRVPAGTATWTLSTTVAGQEYRTTVHAGSHGRAECYDPRWDVTARAETVNEGGTLAVRTTVTNDTAEPMQVGAAVAGRSADAVRLGAGETTTLTVPTGARTLDPGQVELRLYRWVADADGDAPEHGVVPTNAPKASYAGATLAPATAGAATLAGSCTPADGSSWHTVSVPVDNTASTLPVRFATAVRGSESAVRVDGGRTGVLELSVPWGTRSLTVSADGRELGSVDVPAFAGCVTPSWPAGSVDVDVATRCVDDRAQVVVTLRNRGTTDYRANLARDGAGSAALPAGGEAVLHQQVGGLEAPAGSVTLQFGREFEGQRHVAERELAHAAVSCRVVAPQARLDLGDVQVSERWWRTTSTRSAAVVLDNSGSSVPVEFTVSGTGGDRTTTVDARSTQRLDVGTVVGRRGASYDVSAGGWSTTLAVEPFTGAAAGWCAPRARWGQDYAVGDVASRRGTNYRYVGWEPRGEAAQGDAPGRSGQGKGHGKGQGKGQGDANGHDGARGQARGHDGRGPWVALGRCEYR